MKETQPKFKRNPFWNTQNLSELSSSVLEFVPTSFSYIDKLSINISDNVQRVGFRWERNY